MLLRKIQEPRIYYNGYLNWLNITLGNDSDVVNLLGNLLFTTFFILKFCRHWEYCFVYVSR
jgi:hypothetical protein